MSKPKISYPKMKFLLECAVDALQESGCEAHQVRLAMREISGLIEPKNSLLNYPELDSLPKLPDE